MPSPTGCILVLGTHRSGTSVTTAALQAVGCSLGEPLLFVGDENPRGHFEHVDVVAQHEAMLAAVDCNWHEPVQPMRRAGARLRRRWTDEIADLFVSISADSTGWFAVKDPRMVRFVPLWDAALARMRVRRAVIVTVRHPYAVASSLHRRNGLSTAAALALWRHDVAAIAATGRRLDHAVVPYEHLVADAPTVMQRAVIRARMPISVTAEAADALRQVVAPELNRSPSTLPESDGHTDRPVDEWYAGFAAADRVRAWRRSLRSAPASMRA